MISVSKWFIIFLKLVFNCIGREFSDLLLPMVSVVTVRESFLIALKILPTATTHTAEIHYDIVNIMGLLYASIILIVIRLLFRQRALYIMTKCYSSYLQFMIFFFEYLS